MSQFPPGFLWGVATAAYQVEGESKGVGGAGRSGTRSPTPGLTSNGENGDLAVDHYHRYTEDVALMSEIGVNAYRFSIAWSRSFLRAPVGSIQAGIDFYRRLCRSCWGGDHSGCHLVSLGSASGAPGPRGWLSPESVDWFAEYAAVAKATLGDVVNTWVTLNRPWCVAFLGHSSGEHAPWYHRHSGLPRGRSSPDAGPSLGDRRDAGHLTSGRRLSRHRAESHPRLAPERHRGGSSGSGLRRSGSEPAVRRAVIHARYPEEVLALFERYGVSDAIDVDELARARQPIDFLGVNYYNINHIEHVGGTESMRHGPGPGGQDRAASRRLTEMGWGVEPEGLTWVLERVGRVSGRAPDGL